MELKIEEVKKLIAERFRGNQSWFAEDVGVDRGYLNQILNGKINNDSPRICNSLIKYCETNGLDYRHYINFFSSQCSKKWTERDTVQWSEGVRMKEYIFEKYFKLREKRPYIAVTLMSTFEVIIPRLRRERKWLIWKKKF